MTFLLDTDVLSERRKRNPDRNVVRWFADNLRADAYISALVPGEIRYGIERIRRRDPALAAALDRWLGELRSAYRRRILAITTEIAEEWGHIDAARRMPTADGLMAATAKVHRLTLVTRNHAHFAACGVPVVNPFEG
jgi:predicted nucleic acid-binding protein